MEKHNLLEAIACNPVILREGKDIFDSRLRGPDQMLLDVNPALFPAGGLKDGFEFLIFQGTTGPHGVGHQSFDLQFRNSQGVDPPADPFNIFHKVLDTCPDRGLNLGGHDKSFTL